MAPSNFSKDHKAYIISQLGQLVRLTNAVKNLADPEIAAANGFVPIIITVPAVWKKLRSEKTQELITRLRDDYLKSLRTTLPITADEYKMQVCQDVIDNSKDDQQRLKALELVHKIQQTKSWQDALAKSGGNQLVITPQLLKNIITETDDLDKS